MKRVLVTGGTGFIGRHTLPALRERDFEVHAVGRTRPTAFEGVFHAADLLDRSALERAVKAAGASHLLHLAWYAEPGKFWDSPINLDWAGATLGLVRAFREGGGERAVIAGTCAEYQWGSDRFDEASTPCEPASLYGVAKDATRRIAESYAALTGMSLAWARVFFPYGPGERKGRLVADAVEALLANQEFATTEGLQRRDFMYVKDTAAAFAALLESDVQGPVNMGTGTPLTVRALLEMLAEETGEGHLIRFGARPMGANDPLVIVANTDRLRNEVGFSPRFDLRMGLSDSVRARREGTRFN